MDGSAEGRAERKQQKQSSLGSWNSCMFALIEVYEGCLKASYYSILSVWVEFDELNFSYLLKMLDL